MSLVEKNKGPGHKTSKYGIQTKTPQRCVLPMADHQEVILKDNMILNTASEPRN